MTEFTQDLKRCLNKLKTNRYTPAYLTVSTKLAQKLSNLELNDIKNKFRLHLIVDPLIKDQNRIYLT